MPLYEYECPNGHKVEVLQRMTEEQHTEYPCDQCSETAKRVYGGFTFGFKDDRPEWQKDPRVKIKSKGYEMAKKFNL